MSYFVFRRLRLRELELTKYNLQFANRALEWAKGIIWDVIVRVENFRFLLDFVVMHIEEKSKTQVIMGRPFLVMGGAPESSKVPSIQYHSSKVYPIDHNTTHS